MRLLFLLLFVSLSGCFVHAEEGYVEACGYEALPYSQPADEYYPADECQVWYSYGYYSECYETWCYTDFLCEWELYDYGCYPI